MTTTNTRQINTLRAAFAAIASQADGRFNIRRIGDLRRALAERGISRLAPATEQVRAALRIVGEWHGYKLAIGDVVVADYYGSIVMGRICSFDGSGYVYLDAVCPGSLEHNGRANDDGLALSPAQRRAGMIRIGRKPFKSIAIADDSALGGCYGRE